MKQDIKKQITQSIYIKWFQKAKTSILISMFLAAFLTILTYPGILYSDSYNRITLTDHVDMALHAFAQGQADLTRWGCWLTVLPSFFIMLCRRCTGGIALYTFLQCFCFLTVLCSFTARLNQRKHPVWNRICIFLSPVVAAYGVYYEAGIGCVTAIMVILVLLWKWEQMETRLDKGISTVLLLLAAFVCFGYRANAFSVLPVFVVLALAKGKGLRKKILPAATVTIGFGLTVLIPAMFHINTMSSSMAAYAWETITTIQMMDAQTQDKYADYLDDLFGAGATAEALRCSDISEDDTTSMSHRPL